MVVTIDTPAADPVPLFGAGSLVDVVAHVSVQDGTDFVDGTSIQVTVTKEGSVDVLETGQLVLDSGDIYTGRVSLGDLDSDTYTLKVTARSSGGAVGGESGRLRRSTPARSIVVTAPVPGRSYKRSLTIEVIATDTFGLMGRPRPPSAPSR